MNTQIKIPPVLPDNPVDDLAEGSAYRGDEPLEGLKGGLLPTLEAEPPHLTARVDFLPDASQAPMSQPPTAETGVMPIVAAHAEGAYDNDRQDAMRTTAEVQIVVVASTGR